MEQGKSLAEFCKQHYCNNCYSFAIVNCFQFMSETIAQFPILPHHPATVGGQIFAVDSLAQQLATPVQELVPDVKPSELTQQQMQVLEELSVYQHATADLLLRNLRLRSIRFLQKQIYAMYDANNPADGFVQFLYPPKHNPQR
jgi:hypothetical protein